MFSISQKKQSFNKARKVFERKNIVVAGGAGFIGSHLCENLLKDANVICIDNFISGSERNIDHLLANPYFRFLKQDINTVFDLKDIPELEDFQIRFQGVEEIYNLACPHAPTEFEEQEESTLLANSIGMKNICDMALSFDAKLVHFSSGVVYGARPKDGHRISEEECGEVNSLSLRATYDEGKRFSETIANFYRRHYNLSVKILRVFRTYGPRMPLDRGHMIPDFVLAALRGESLMIFGDEHFFTSLCYVSDVVNAAEKLMKAKDAQVINVGGSEEFALADVAKEIVKLTESKSLVSYSPPILMMAPLGIPNIEKAQKLLGWIPLVSLQQGLKHTITYIKAEHQLLRL